MNILGIILLVLVILVVGYIAFIALVMCLICMGFESRDKDAHELIEKLKKERGKQR